MKQCDLLDLDAREAMSMLLTNLMDYAEVARQAYQMADAMADERRRRHLKAKSAMHGHEPTPTP